ncbi:uncharacterized protein LOC113747694 [Larimichthys crocea]|uniref:uncharacterized protein LOC113747694 n=1 Tax=Larimichthys crocea TaxID=215358 RepID=UPI000F60350D|nr:uncharacterized protein LOC113747694 [Larimichthys crocea]
MYIVIMIIKKLLMTLSIWSRSRPYRTIIVLLVIDFPLLKSSLIQCAEKQLQMYVYFVYNEVLFFSLPLYRSLSLPLSLPFCVCADNTLTSPEDSLHSYTLQHLCVCMCVWVCAKYECTALCICVCDLCVRPTGTGKAPVDPETLLARFPLSFPHPSSCALFLFGISLLSCVLTNFFHLIFSVFFLFIYYTTSFSFPNKSSPPVTLNIFPFFLVFLSVTHFILPCIYCFLSPHRSPLTLKLSLFPFSTQTYFLSLFLPLSASFPSHSSFLLQSILFVSPLSLSLSLTHSLLPHLSLSMFVSITPCSFLIIAAVMKPLKPKFSRHKEGFLIICHSSFPLDPSTSQTPKPNVFFFNAHVTLSPVCSVGVMWLISFSVLLRPSSL